MGERLKVAVIGFTPAALLAGYGIAVGLMLALICGAALIVVTVTALWEMREKEEGEWVTGPQGLK
jgi:hypothetical protein